MIPGLKRRSVAVVGRAAYLLGSRLGRAIDACDVVVRANWLLPIEGAPADVGERTTIIYHCRGCIAQKDAAVGREIVAVPVDTKLRKRLAKGSHLDYRAYRPTTGVVAIFDALKSGAASVHAFGFDLYASGYAAFAPPPSGTRNFTWDHDAAGDRRLLQKLLRKNPRFKPDARLRAVLAGRVAA